MFAAELVAAKRAGSIAAGLVAFVVLAVGFLIASGLWIAYRVHWEKTRVAAFVEDTATPVRALRCTLPTTNCSCVYVDMDPMVPSPARGRVPLSDSSRQTSHV